jgi:hypothetical protein
MATHKSQNELYKIFKNLKIPRQRIDTQAKLSEIERVSVYYSFATTGYKFCFYRNASPFGQNRIKYLYLMRFNK